MPERLREGGLLRISMMRKVIAGLGRQRGMNLRDRIQKLLSPTQNKSGCHMAAAKEISERARHTLIQHVNELGPWFHNFEIASGMWTNPSGRFPGVEYPLERWRLYRTSPSRCTRKIVP